MKSNILLEDECENSANCFVKVCLVSLLLITGTSNDVEIEITSHKIDCIKEMHEHAVPLCMHCFLYKWYM